MVGPQPLGLNFEPRPAQVKTGFASKVGSVAMIKVFVHFCKMGFEIWLRILENEIQINYCKSVSVKTFSHLLSYDKWRQFLLSVWGSNFVNFFWCGESLEQFKMVVILFYFPLPKFITSDRYMDKKNNEQNCGKRLTMIPWSEIKKVEGVIWLEEICSF